MQIIHEGRFYQIVDMGSDWRGYFQKRYHLEIKPEFNNSVLTTYASADEASMLVMSLIEADNFHARQLGLMEAA